MECNTESKEKIHKELSIKDEKSNHYSKFKFNKRVVKIEYSNKDLRNLIDPKFAHLKCDDKEQIVNKIKKANIRNMPGFVDIPLHPCDIDYSRYHWHRTLPYRPLRPDHPHLQ